MIIKELPPYAPTLMESTRAIGYSSEAAIADVIDNSIAASAEMVDISFFPMDDPYITILDNGNGMSDNELQHAMQYGSKSPLDIRAETDLGRYGLGLKTASLSQCRKLTVISKKNNKISGCQWDLDYIAKSKSWSLILLEENELHNYPNFKKLQEVSSGTLLIWQKLDKFSVGEQSVASAFQKKMADIRQHLALVFHRYIQGEPGIKKLQISMNDVRVEPHDPFLASKSTILMDAESIKVRNREIKIVPYILPHVSKLTKQEIESLGGKDGLRKQQGFYIYRNKRLLVWGTWFRMVRKGEASKLARVQVDIPNSLDDLWTLDIKKSTAMPPEVVKKNLNVIIRKIAEASKRTWTYRGKKETNDDGTHLWNRIVTRNGSAFYEINSEYPLIGLMEQKYPKIKHELKILLRQVSLSLPLNALFVDLTNDRKLDNDKEQDVKEIIEDLKIALMSEPEFKKKKEMIEVLKLAEPFSRYAEEIGVAFERGEFND